MVYDEQPEDFIADIEVVACLLEQNNKILLLHRHDNKPEGNKWGLPGGKVDIEDKDEKSAVLRELREETGLFFSPDELSYHKTFFVSHLGYNFLYHYFYCSLEEIPQIVISPNEHKDFVWVTKEEALNMPLVLDEDHCMKDFYGIK